MAVTPPYDFLYESLLASHRFQVERMDRLRERLNWMTGVLILEGTGVASLVLNYRLTGCGGEHFVRDFVFAGGVVLSMLLFAAAALLTGFCLLRGFKYAVTPPPGELFDAANELLTYNANPAVLDKIDVVDDLKKQLCEVLVSATTHNMTLNEKRNNWILWAMRCAFISGLLLILPATAAILAKYDTSRPQPVEIVNSVKVTR